jgi:hypothetical protein
MINVSIAKSTILGISLFFATAAIAQKGKPEKNKFLEGKKYDAKFTEIKKTGAPKPLPGLIVIKGGKVQCDLMEEKLKAPAMQYKVTSDTTYTEDETEIHKLSFESEFTEEKTTYKWDATITNFEIEGTFIMLKGGVEKKRFEFTGEEKAKKK